MLAPVLPRAQSAIAGANLRPTAEWFDFFRLLFEFVAQSGLLDPDVIASILARLDALEQEGDTFTIEGLMTVKVAGTPESGAVQLYLDGDTLMPGNTYYYGTGPDGTKGWFDLSFLNLSDTPDDYTGQSGRFVDVVSAETGLEFSALYIDHAGAIYDAGTLVYPSPVAFEDTLLVGSAGNEQDAIKINGVSTPARIKSSKFGGTATVLCHQHSTTNYPQFIMSRSNSDAASHTAVTNGMTIGGVIAVGWANSTPGYIPVGSVDFEVDATGTVSATSMPGRVSFKVTPNGGVTPVEFLGVSNSGASTFKASPLKLAPAAGAAEQQIDVVASVTGDFTWLRGGVRRWQLRMNSTAESGGNVGSDLDFRYYTDAGVAALGARWARSTGILNFSLTPTVLTTPLALISASITNGDTTHSPSGDAVFDALAGKEPTITAGTTAQFWRGDKTWSDWLDGDFRLGQSAGIAGNGRELVISAGATANTLARIGLRGNRTGSGNVGAINFYNGAASDAQICGLAATQDGADDAGAFLISAKQTGVAAVNVLQISYNTARPRTDNTISLGLSSARWTELHTFNIAQYGARHETGVVSPAQITANTDNWAVAGLSTAGVIRASTDASRNLTGIASPTSGQALLLVNVGAFDLVLVHDATSTAANRFLCPGSANLTLNPNDSVRLWYDNTSSRWRVIGV